jgi:hypothetical protein
MRLRSRVRTGRRWRDIHKAFGNTPRHSAHANVVDAPFRQHIDFLTQELLQVINQFEEAKTERLVKLDQEIDIAIFDGSARCVRTEESDASNAKLVGEIASLTLK